MCREREEFCMIKHEGNPKWKVFFDGDFWGHHGRDHAGKEITLNKDFFWAGHRWLIPAAYSCSKGMVIDFCMRVEAEQLQAFMDKWKLSEENDSYECFTREQQMEMELDNPMQLDFTAQICLNGRTLRTSCSCAVSCHPCISEEVVCCEPAAKHVMEHYGLDAASGWVIYRNTFPWAARRRPEFQSFSITMNQQPADIPGPRFQAGGSGDTVSFVHPANEDKYVLTVQEMEHQTVPEKGFGSDCCEYPTHYSVMSYTLSPEIPDGALTIEDCAEGDRPKKKAPRPASSDGMSGAAAVSIIGGADGPTAVFVGGSSKKGRQRVACSSLHFSPVDDVEWRIVFHEKKYKGDDPMTVSFRQEEALWKEEK